MAGFGWGLFFGSTCTIALAAIAGAWAYQRFVLLERRTRQAERLAEIGALTGGLAHEIKNPLSTVQLNLQLLQEDLLPDNPAYSRIMGRLGTVQRETARLRDILEDFLRYAGRLELDRRPTELNELLEELVDFFAPQAQIHRVQLRLKRHPTPVNANVDPKLIKQALLNLMINALQAMPDGGELILCVEPRGPGREVLLEVTDTGTGIPPDVIPKIFQAYYSTKRGGTGIGLAMTQRIVLEHGGSINVESAPGKGTRFQITLPTQS
jgi:signal transduction histidine kinase